MSSLITNPFCLVNSFEELRMFLANLEVFGSMPTDHNASSDGFFITDIAMQSRLLTV
jgi:hypothetical protein